MRMAPAAHDNPLFPSRMVASLSIAVMPELTHAQLLRRLLALSWRYWRKCLAVFGYQVALLAFGVIGLGLSGLAIDLIRHTLEPGAAAPRCWEASSSPSRWREPCSTTPTPWQPAISCR